MPDLQTGLLTQCAANIVAHIAGPHDANGFDLHALRRLGRRGVTGKPGLMQVNPLEPIAFRVIAPE